MVLFEDCNFNLGGIRSIYLLTQLDEGKTYPYFPLSYNVMSGDTSIIDLIAEPAQFERISINEGSTVEEERISDKNGKYFEQKVTIVIPKVLIGQSQFLNAFLFKRSIVSASYVVRPINIDAYNTCAIFLDNNNQWWISGYDAPLKITDFSLSVGDNNSYELELTSTSYSRIRKINPNWTVVDNTLVFS